MSQLKAIKNASGISFITTVQLHIESVFNVMNEHFQLICLEIKKIVCAT